MLRLVISLLCIVNLYAEPFADAKFSKASGNIIQGKNSVETGSNSRVELTFSDSTIARVGSNSKFRYISGSRKAILDNGTLLFSLPRDVGGVAIQAGSVVAASTGGDFQLSNVKGASKVISLNGDLIAGFAANPKESVRLRYGEMIDVPFGSTKMPKPTSINLKTLISTSALMKMGTLPSQKAIEKNSNNQKGAKPSFRIGTSLDAGDPVAGIALQSLTVQQIAAVEQQQAQQAVAVQQAQQETAAAQATQQQAQATQQQAAANARQLETARQLMVIQQQQRQQQQEAAVRQQQANQGQGPQGNQGQGPQGNQGNQGQGQEQGNQGQGGGQGRQ